MNKREHYWDALRAFTMMLVVAVHAAGFASGQMSSRSVILETFLDVTRGFRMQLFFLVSGFFSAMLWRQRGIGELARNRFQRIFIPFVLACLTINPLYHSIVNWNIHGGKPAPQALIEAVRQGDLSYIKRYLDAGGRPNTRGPRFGIPLLARASMQGSLPLTQFLLDRGADPNIRFGAGMTALHGAALFGHDAIVKLLVQRGADPLKKNTYGQTPYDVTSHDWADTVAMARNYKMPVRSNDEALAGRERCRALLPASKPLPQDLLSRLSRQIEGVNRGLLERLPNRPFVPVLNHLWFLWYLCWLFPPLWFWTWLRDRREVVLPPARWVVSPLRLLWLLPLTLVPQAFMGIINPRIFGPDTSNGAVPHPHVLLYYGIFFFFGVLYYEYKDREGVFGRAWRVLIPVALLVILPLARMLIETRILADFLEVLFAWLMAEGLVGLFRHSIQKENKLIRYLADASYWCYLAHYPLLAALQGVLLKIPLPVELFVLANTIVTTAIVLVLYQFLVRNTWLGVLLNGRRARDRKP